MRSLLLTGLLLLLVTPIAAVAEPIGAGDLPEREVARVMAAEEPATVIAGSGSLTGTVSYPQTLVLTPDAVANVVLADVTSGSAPATTIGEQTIATSGKHDAITFEISYDPATIDPSHRYAVEARITDQGRLVYVATTPYLAVTQLRPTSDAGTTMSLLGPLPPAEIHLSGIPTAGWVHSDSTTAPTLPAIPPTALNSAPVASAAVGSTTTQQPPAAATTVPSVAVVLIATMFGLATFAVVSWLRDPRRRLVSG